MLLKLRPSFKKKIAMIGTSTMIQIFFATSAIRKPTTWAKAARSPR
jgi:hypothetical protein